jgi:hypothetical protein
MLAQDFEHFLTRYGRARIVFSFLDSAPQPALKSLVLPVQRPHGIPQHFTR